VRNRFTLEEPIGVHQGTKRDHCLLSRKWAKELDYRLIKEMWTFTGNRIAVRFAYEWHDDSDHCYRSYGKENWEFNDDGHMASRFASINDIPILGSERKYHWVLGRRPDDHPGLSDSASNIAAPGRDEIRQDLHTEADPEAVPRDNRLLNNLVRS
jgi:nuclear transport factor 2 (NTF2) superfamily protein